MRARDETKMHPANRLANLRRRVNRARKFPENTCGASRHLHLMADALAAGQEWWAIHEEPAEGAASMYSVLESLWKARTELKRWKPKHLQDAESRRVTAHIDAALKAAVKKS